MAKLNDSKFDQGRAVLNEECGEPTTRFVHLFSGTVIELSKSTKAQLSRSIDAGLCRRVALRHPELLRRVMKPHAAKKLDAAGRAGVGRKAKRKASAASAKRVMRMISEGDGTEVGCKRRFRGWEGELI